MSSPKWQVKFEPYDRITYPSTYTVFTAETEESGYAFIDTMKTRTGVFIHNSKTKMNDDVRCINGAWRVTRTIQ